METPDQLVVFTLHGRQMALPLPAVERIVRAVEVTPLPHAPPIVRGVIVVQGQVVPVLDLRAWSGPPPELALSDLLIIAHGATRTVALVAEETGGLLEVGLEDVTPTESIDTALEDVAGLVRREGAVILALRVDRLLSGEGEAALRAYLEGTRDEKGVGNGR